MMSKYRKNIFSLFLVVFFLFSVPFVFASTEVLDVRVIEYISEVIAYDQTSGEDNVISDTRGELGETREGQSRTGHTLHDFQINGMVNISNVERVGNASVVSINVTVNGTYNITDIWLEDAPPGNYLVYNISSGPEPENNGTISIFIAELRANHSAVFNFNISGYGMGEPLNFTEEYSSWRMMTGNATNVTLNVTNSFPTSVRLTDLVIEKTPGCYPSWSGITCFRFTDLHGEDAGNATIFDRDSRTVLQWNASGNDIVQDEKRQIKFLAWAPENVTRNLSGEYYWNDSEDWAAWMNMGNISSNFNFNGSISGLELINVTGIVPDARLSVSKNRVNESHWNASFNITNDAVAAIDYNVSYISIWATQHVNHVEDFDPGNQNNWVTGTNVSAYGISGLIGPTANVTWWPKFKLENSTSNTSFSILFNYSLVPVVWSHANFEILDDGTQIFKLNRTETERGGYLFIEEIYVLLGGYLVKVTKQVEPIDLSPDINVTTYEINITIENMGREKTPEWISMFDLVPKDYHPLQHQTDVWAATRNMTRQNRVFVTTFDGTWTSLNSPAATTGSYATVWGSADTGEIGSGPYEGYWGYHVDFHGLNATSDGDGRYDNTASTKEIGVHYRIGGNSTISRIENAYIVGVDPIRLEGANPSRTVASKLAASSTTMEYLVLIASLIVSITVLSLGFGFFRKKQ